MKIIRLTKRGEAISDFNISNYVDVIVSAEPNAEFNISTGMVIDELRARIAEGVIDTNDYTVMVDDENGELQQFNIDKNGRSQDWQPIQYTFENTISRILSASIKKHKDEKL
mgnify:CR=1 FL=1